MFFEWQLQVGFVILLIRNHAFILDCEFLKARKCFISMSLAYSIIGLSSFVAHPTDDCLWASSVSWQCVLPASSRVHLSVGATLVSEAGPLLSQSPLSPFAVEAALTSLGQGNHSRSWNVLSQPSTPVWTRGKTRTCLRFHLMVFLRVSELLLLSIRTKLPGLSNVSRRFWR